MLVLTRKIGERIVIDGVIVIEVLRAQGNQVRIGIRAPRGVAIRRQELPTHDHSEAHEGDARSTGQAPL
jgi:carbon storage regulator